MKVALVHDWLNGMRGGEKILEVLVELCPQAHVFTLHYDSEKVSDIINKMPIHTSFIQKLPLRAKYYRYYLPLFPKAIESFDLSGYDLVISTSHCVAKGVKAMPGSIHICYCFTPMRYVWEFAADYFGFKSLIYKPILARLKKWDRNTAVRPNYFFSISQNVAVRIKKHYNRTADIIYPPVNTDFFVPQDGDDDFYLVVSALVPYKRIDLAVRAFNQLGKPLKIIGTGTEWARLRRMAQPNIEFLGWQADEVIRDYYAKCRAFVFPGVEDFGITVLEAQSCGRPVIAYAAGGALETVNVKQKTGVFFYEQTPDALVAAVKEFERNKDYFKKELIRESVLGFDRKLFKEKLKTEIAQVIESK